MFQQVAGAFPDGVVVTMRKADTPTMWWVAGALASCVIGVLLILAGFLPLGMLMLLPWLFCTIKATY
jgi:hypothetical protein